MNNQILKRKQRVIIIIFILLLFILYAYPLTKSHLIYGSDSPYYLIYAKETIRHPSLRGTQVPILLPILIAALSLGTSINVLTSLKIIVLLLSCIIPLTVFLFAKKFFGTKTAIFSLFWVLASPTFYRLTNDLYNNLISEIFIIISFVVILFNIRGIYKFTLAGLLLGLAFWSHTLTPLVAVAIYLFDGLVKLIITKRVQVLIRYVYIILIGVMSSFPQSLPFLFKSPTSQNDPEFYITPLLVDSFNKFSEYLSSIGKNPQILLSTMYTFSNILYEWIGPIIILFTLGGIILLIKNRSIINKSLIISALVIPLTLTLISSTGAIGFSDRFIHFIFFPTAVLSSYFLIHIPQIISNYNSSLKKSPNIPLFTQQIITGAIFTIVAINTYPKQIAQVLYRKPTISTTEYNIYKETQKYISTNDLVLINDIHFYWFKEVNMNYNISIYEYYVTQDISKGNNDFGYYNPTAEYSKNAYLVAQDSPLTYNESIKGLCTLKDVKKAKKLFIFFNSSEPGIDVNKMVNHPKDFLPIFVSNKYYLFLLNNSSCVSK